jgi:DNA-binding XRE family transcriptional regulator
MELRDKLGLNKTEFANQLGLKSYNIRDIESGKQKIPIELAEKIEEKFSINGWWLLTGKGDMFLKKDGDICSDIENHIGDKEIDLLKSFRKLDEKKQEMYLFRIKADALEEEIKNDANHIQGDAKYA